MASNAFDELLQDPSIWSEFNYFIREMVNTIRELAQLIVLVCLNKLTKNIASEY